MDLYNKTERFVKDTLSKINNQSDIAHAERTVYWIKQLKPEADEALLIAGIAHDIERAFNGDWKKGSSNPDDLRKHQELSTDIVGKFLSNRGATEELIKRVKNLVAHHEEGGDEDQNVLCDADCLAWLDQKAVRKAGSSKEEGKTSEYKEKLNYIYNRINSPIAKQLAKKWYNKALQELVKI